MGSDRFGKYYRNGSNWIILAMDKRELALVNVTGRRIMKLHEEQITALVICVVIIGCFVVTRYMWL